MINGIHHTSMTTLNLDRMVRFYTEQLGFEIAWQHHIRKTPDIDAVVGEAGSSFRVAMLRTGTSFVEVFERIDEHGGDTPEQSSDDENKSSFSKLGYKHFALDVTDIDAEYQRLSAAGVKFNCPPKTFGNVKGTYAYDPDGNVFELQEIMHEKLPFHLTRGGKNIVGWDDNYNVSEGEIQANILKASNGGSN